MSQITSLQNRRVKDAIKLRDHRGRAKQRRFLIHGMRELTHAVRSGIACREAFVCDELLGQSTLQLIPTLVQQGCELLRVSKAVWEKLTYGNRQSGLLVVAETPAIGLERLCVPEQALVIILEGVEKPGNIGAVIRSADGAGGSAMILADGGGDLFNPNTIRASLGTVFCLPIAAAPCQQVLAWLRQQNFTIYAALIGGRQRYSEVDFRGRTAIALGSEASGLSPLWQAGDVQPIQIPMHGTADSLNVSAAAAVLLYEAARQREPLET